MRVFLQILLVVVALALRASVLLVLIGPPFSGKTTQAEILHRDFGMAVIPAADLIARNQRRFKRFRNPTLAGVEARLEPALNALIEEALQSTDPWRQKFVNCFRQGA